MLLASDQSGSGVMLAIVAQLFTLLTLIANQIYQSRSAEKKRQWEKEDREMTARELQIKADAQAVQNAIQIADQTARILADNEAKARLLARVTKSNADVVVAKVEAHGEQVSNQIDTVRESAEQAYSAANAVNEKIANLTSAQLEQTRHLGQLRSPTDTQK